MNTKIYQKTQLPEIKEALLKGATIAFPTDTVFGLGCIASNKEAEKKIYQAKGRSFTKPLPMMCNGLEMIKRYAKVSADDEKLIKALTPGALTIIFRKKEEEGTIAIRIPNDQWILDLLKELDVAMLVTSANLSDQGSLKDFSEVLKELNGRIDGIVEGNASSLTSSTIVDCTDDLKILRVGDISAETIAEVLNG